tara:strand:+ start:120 stop:422 length:303 start_codon:yes stop_codon:yes gene_type:complete
MERNLRGLEDGPDRHGELLAAEIALDDALAERAFGMRLGLTATLGRKPLSVAALTMGADRAVGPVKRLKVLAGCVFVLEARGVDICHVLTLGFCAALSSI